jgi:2-polyprenyl-3-methyl-5-hydroxy-6-metoxy-1,4-benzoquinol methylase
MEPHAFVKEVYRSMSVRHAAAIARANWSEMQTHAEVRQAAHEIQGLLPQNSDGAILDIGFGSGWFLAACLTLGYTNLSGADFGIGNKMHVAAWGPQGVRLFEIKDNIGDFLADREEQYDFVHMSHVIEHIPKYSLLWVVDALYRSLKPGGTLMLRTPNMESPCANSSYYVTLAHEYGFSSSNLESLLDICGFDEIRFQRPTLYKPNAKQKIGNAVRRAFLRESAVKHRLFGVNRHGIFGSELVVTARRGAVPPFFDPKYK